MLKLILAPAGGGKTAFITDEIRRRVSQREAGVFLLVPEQYSHEAERELCRVCGDSLSLYAEVLSFSRLAVRVAQETGTGGKTPLDGGGRLLCMSLALSQISHALSLYPAAKNKAELQAGLLQAVTELKTAHISPDALLETAAAVEPGLAAKLRDLTLCLEAYDAVLAQGRADPADRLLRLADTLGQSSVGTGGHIYIDGFTDFTGAELAVIHALLQKNAPLTVCLSCDGLYSEAEHFAPSRRAAHTLLRYAKELGLETELITPPNSARKAAPLTFLAEKLYNYTAAVMDDAEGRVRVFRADSPRAECELAAAECLRLARENNCRWRDIAIAVRGFEGYAAALEETFRFYGVPLFTARRGSILQKPIAALIADAFEILQGGWETDAVLSYLKTGLTGLTLAERDALERYAALWQVRGSLWTRTAPWSLHPEGFGAEPTAESAAQLERLDALRRSLVSPLAALSEKGKQAQTAAGQVRALADFLAQLALPQTLEHTAHALEASGRPLLAAEYVQLWDIVCGALEQTAAILGDTPMTQEQFAKLFLQTLSQYDVSAIPVSLDRVSAGDMDRMRRRHIKHLIILGASDEHLPQLRPGGGILSEEEREELSALGLSLGGTEDNLARELSLVYNCVTLPAESLTIAYSAATDSGTQARPSFLITRARLLFGLEEMPVDLARLRLSAPEPAFLLAAGHGEDEAAQLARAYFSADDTGRERLAALKARAELERGMLSESAVRQLYGETLSLSPTRTDAYAACRFSYFLRYGLKLDERERAGFEAPELGSFMHYVLEGVASELAAGQGFKNVSAEAVYALADVYIARYAEEALGGLSDKSPRFTYLFMRLAPAVRRIVADMVRELSKSDFVPLDFELALRAGGELPPVCLSDGKNTLLLSGIADRVDGCFRDGKLYLRVIDYKTGKKSFSLSDVWYGMGMQMLLYLFALEETGRARYGAEVVPAGVLYVPARDALISADRELSDEALEKEKAKSRKRSGLILDDISVIAAMENSETPEYLPISVRRDGSLSTDSLASPAQLRALHAHVDRSLLALADSLACGKIEAAPYYRGESDNACLYCPYFRVCRFDEKRDKRRYLTKLKPEEFWEKLEDEK